MNIPSNLKASHFNEIFYKAISQYHIKDDLNQQNINPYLNSDILDSLLYEKCWIDTVQWHLEDLIRDPNINPIKAVELKRNIDFSNQQRTDLVEKIDDYIFEIYKEIKLKNNYIINTESIGWAIDRLSILNLKLYHWQQETQRQDISKLNLQRAVEKYKILEDQHTFLSKAIDELISNIFSGVVVARPFKQMKMYNDPETNPILRKLNKK